MTDFENQSSLPISGPIMIVGGTSAVASVLSRRLGRVAEIITAGRDGCDFDVDLRRPADEIRVPAGTAVVVNAAASFHSNSDDQFIESAEVNVLGPLKLLSACHAATVGQFVQISSIFANLPPESTYFTNYALHKRQGDENLLALSDAASETVCTVLRPTRLYGPSDFHKEHQPFLHSLVDDAAAGREIVLSGNHDAHRNFLHIDDFAAIVERVIALRLPGCHDCPSLERLSYEKIAESAAAAFGGRSTVRFDGLGPDTPDDADSTDASLYELIGVAPTISFAEGMRIEARRRGAS